MRNDVNETSHLIGDDGVYENVKIRQAKVFIALCRIMTVALAVLGFMALFVGTR